MRSSIWMVIGWVMLLACQPLAAADVVLNEYNAVSGGNRLDDGSGADPFFGTIFGNGGNWFELLVVEDNIDMRGWTLDWTEDESVSDTETAMGTITLSSADLWSDIRRGTIITFIETIDAGGEDGFDTSTDTSFDPDAGDWWINIATQEEVGKGEAGLVSTVTNDGDAGDFSVGKDDWTLTIKDASQGVVFGPVGEGTESWQGGKVNSEEGGSLEGPVTDGAPITLEMWQAVTPASEFYDDTGSTSFGQLNQDYDEATKTFSPIQDLSALRGGEPPLGNGDFDGDGMLTTNDINLLTAEVIAGTNNLEFDVDLNGVVDDSDRGAWVRGLKMTYFGDADLDGEFNSADLVTVLAGGQYEDDIVGNSLWETGDWNGDAEFTSADLVTALADGGYEQGPRAGVAAVPEPASGVLALLAVLGCLQMRRRR